MGELKKLNKLTKSLLQVQLLHLLPHNILYLTQVLIHLVSVVVVDHVLGVNRIRRLAIDNVVLVQVMQVGKAIAVVVLVAVVFARVLLVALGRHISRVVHVPL